MKAVQYQIETAFFDEYDVIHVLMTNQKKGSFFPLYLEAEMCDDVVAFFEDESSMEKIKMRWAFFIDSWIKNGFEIKSIVLDNIDGGGVFLPVITFSQDQMGARTIYVTNFIPIGEAIACSLSSGVPFYVTNRAEEKVDSMSLSNLSRYIEETKFEEVEDE